MSGPPKSKPLDVLSLAAVGQEGFQTELEGSRRRANGTAEGTPWYIRGKLFTFSNGKGFRGR